MSLRKRPSRNRWQIVSITAAIGGSLPLKPAGCRGDNSLLGPHPRCWATYFWQWNSFLFPWRARNNKESALFGPWRLPCRNYVASRGKHPDDWQISRWIHGADMNWPKCRNPIGNPSKFMYPKYPDPSKAWLFWGPIHPCYTGSNPSIGGSNDLMG